MLRTTLATLLVIAATCCSLVICDLVPSGSFVCSTSACNTVIQNRYEENFSYFSNPHCKPSKLDRGIQCSNIEAEGGLYTNYGLHYIPLASSYYVARLADAMGYQAQCPTNTTFLRKLNILSSWSGAQGASAIAIDLACGFKKQDIRKCTLPNGKYPFLCTGVEGPPGTYGKRLETLSYISILQSKNLRWSLFVHCWRAKTPQNPRSEEIATSFNVFNLDPEFSEEDRTLVIVELKKRGFNTDPENIIEYDYSTDNC